MDEQNSKIIYKEQFRMSVRIVKDNLDTILKRKRDFNCGSDFPSV